MRLLVISDIHCLSKDIEQGNGYAGATGSDFFIEERNARRNPILAIANVWKTDAPKIDALICLGDLAHQSKRLPFLQAWHDLHQLAEELAIPEVLAVTGNHDVLSRAEDVSDAEIRLEFLRTVSPDFPHRDQTFKNEYFGTGVATIELGQCCIIAIDTCRTHGHGSSAEVSKRIWEVGHISTGMREQIIAAMKASDASHFVIVMHHHPDRVDDIHDIYTDSMKDGAEFLRDIGSIGKKCIVLHGHKHQVHLKHAAHGSPPPIVFSAATFASKPYPTQSRGFENLFHVVEVDMAEQRFPAGAILSWNWSGTQWGESKHVDMPYYVAFGRPVSVFEIAKSLSQIQITSKVTADELYSICPDLKYLHSNQIDALNDELKQFNRTVYAKHSKISAMLED
ncbi:metallophosphoesterase family protein [Agrobacterium tumefaciens]